MLYSEDNKYWEFNSQAELDSFLNDAMDSGDDYHLKFGISQRGKPYAFGWIKYNVKFGKSQTNQTQQSAQSNQTQTQVQPVVTTF